MRKPFDGIRKGTSYLQETMEHDQRQPVGGYDLYIFPFPPCGTGGGGNSGHIHVLVPVTIKTTYITVRHVRYQTPPLSPYLFHIFSEVHYCVILLPPPIHPSILPASRVSIVVLTVILLQTASNPVLASTNGEHSSTNGTNGTI